MPTVRIARLGLIATLGMLGCTTGKPATPTSSSGGDKNGDGSASASTGGTTGQGDATETDGGAMAAAPGDASAPPLLSCSALASSDACDKCSDDQCCAQLSACVSDTDCSGAADTWDSCWAGTGATVACDTAFADTGPLARAWLGCLSAKCNPQCEAADAGAACAPDDASDPCDVCGSANCCAESVACLLGTDCAKANDQWDACSLSSASATCDTQFAASGPEAKAWYACLTRFCASDCGL